MSKLSKLKNKNREETVEDKPKRRLKSTSNAEVKTDTPKKRGFLQTSTEARKGILAKEDQKAEARKAEYGKLWRFYIKQDDVDKDYNITFLDGDLDDEGLIANPMFYEHNVKVNGRWTNFVSCCEDEPDPLMEAGEQPYAAQAFTVIDHTPYTSKDGKEYKHTKKLFVCKKSTMELLQKIATKNGGLKGLHLSVTRTGNMKPNVGDFFHVEESFSPEELIDILVEDGVKKDDAAKMVEPADYEEQLTYYTAEELVKMGIATKAPTINDALDGDEEDLDEDL